MVQSRTLALWAFPVHTHAMDFFRTRAKALSIMAASLDSKLISGYRWALVRGAAYMLLCASGTSRSLWSVRSVSHFIINDGWSRWIGAFEFPVWCMERSCTPFTLMERVAGKGSSPYLYVYRTPIVFYGLVHLDLLWVQQFQGHLLELRLQFLPLRGKLALLRVIPLP